MTKEQYDSRVIELKSKRKALKLSQEYIARRCKCSWTTISSAEQGKAVVKERVIINYALAVGLKIPSIFQDADAENMEQFYENLPKMLKSKRESLGLSPEDIAAKCEISTTMLSSYERGFIKLNSIAFFNYLEAVGLETSFAPTNVALEETQDVKKKEKKNKNDVTSKLVKQIESMSEKSQKKLLAFLKSLE